MTIRKHLASLASFLARRRAMASDGDQRVLQALREAGSDLARPHTLEFILLLPTEEKALAAAKTLEGEGFTATVMLGAGQGTYWVCEADYTLVPEYAAIHGIAVRLSGLAASLGGSYDGWGTAVVR